MNKKGIADRTWHWLVSMIVITVVCFTFVYTLSLWEERVVETPFQLQQRLIGYRLLTNPDCLAVVQNQRILSGVLDTQKMERNRILSCLPAITQRYSIRVLNGTQTVFSMQRGQVQSGRYWSTFSIDEQGNLLRIEVAADE